MKEGDLVEVAGITSVIDAIGQTGIIIQIFVNDDAAYVLFGSIGKKYISLKALRKIKEGEV